MIEKCFVLLGWKDRLWRIRCYDDERQRWHWKANDAKQLEYKHERCSGISVDFQFLHVRGSLQTLG